MAHMPLVPWGYVLVGLGAIGGCGKSWKYEEEARTAMDIAEKEDGTPAGGVGAWREKRSY
jgi:hypothetical protein